MSRIQEIRQELEKIADSVQKLGADLAYTRTMFNLLLDETVKSSRWYAPEECKCWLTLPNGEFSSNLPLDKFRIILHETFEGFPTKEDAEYYRDIPRLMRPLAKALRELSNKGEWIQWTNEIQAKWIAVYSHITKAWYPIDVVDQHQHQALYAPSEKIMLQALEIAQLEVPV